jgi:hypothetical protein
MRHDSSHRRIMLGVRVNDEARDRVGVSMRGTGLRREEDLWRLETTEAPREPRRGMEIWVQTGAHWAIGDRYTVSRVNGRSFYLAVDGRKERHDLRSWPRWLRERADEGTLTIDGHPLSGVRDEPLATGLSVPMEIDRDNEETGGPMEPRARDARWTRAVRDVLKRYTITREPGGERVVYRVARRGAAYLVRVDPTWREPPSCSCPDADRVRDARGATFCKHTVATLLKDDEHRYQLLDLLL